MSDPAEDTERRRQQRGLEAAARHGELPDPVHALKAHLDGTPAGVNVYEVCRWSLAARLLSDAAEAGADSAADLGVLPLSMPSPNALVCVGVKNGDRWLSVTGGCERIAAAIDDLERSRN